MALLIILISKESFKSVAYASHKHPSPKSRQLEKKEGKIITKDNGKKGRETGQAGIYKGK